MKLETIQKRAALALSDLHPLDPDREVTKWERHRLSHEEFAVPELVLFALTRLHTYKPFGPEEKLRWGISAAFRDIPFSISLEKFGLRLYVPEGTSSELRLALVHCLQKACQLAETCLRDVAKVQIQNGHVTIQNHYHQFIRAYHFFRDKASEAYEAPQPEPVVMRRDEKEVPTLTSHSPFTPQIEGGYLAGAMLDAYFSWLEHALVLVLPFVDFEPGDGHLLRFVGATWDEKWRTVFDLSTDNEAKEAYDLLKRIKEALRNPISHGGFGKKGTSFFFHVDHIGALPALLTKHGRSMDFIITRIPDRTYKELCQQLDLCDEFLKDSKAWAGLRYAEAGLDAAFSDGFRKLCQEACVSDETLEEFIQYQSYMTDMHTNMDY